MVIIALTKKGASLEKTIGTLDVVGLSPEKTAQLEALLGELSDHLDK